MLLTYRYIKFVSILLVCWLQILSVLQNHYILLPEIQISYIFVPFFYNLTSWTSLRSVVGQKNIGSK